MNQEHAMNPANKMQPLRVDVIDNRLVISIGVSALAHFAVRGDEEDDGEPSTSLRIPDMTAFAEELAHVLRATDGDEPSIAARALDEAVDLLVDVGGESFDVVDAGEAQS